MHLFIYIPSSHLFNLASECISEMMVTGLCGRCGHQGPCKAKKTQADQLWTTGDASDAKHLALGGVLLQ
jgi:hypothetical protein